MRTSSVADITAAVRRLCMDACTILGDDVILCLETALLSEESTIGREILERIIQNSRIAAEEKIPLCQDTGMAVVFVELGQDVHLTN